MGDNRPCYGGSVSRITETRRGATMQMRTATRSYRYDGYGRILATIDSEPQVYNETYDYDLNGNVTEIVRGNGTMAYDRISLAYNGNRIAGISDESTTDGDDLPFDVDLPQLAAGDYGDAVNYDDCGRVTRDSCRDIHSVIYNPLGLPRMIRFGTGSRSDNIVVTYRADGVKTGVTTNHYYTEAIHRYNPGTGGDTIIERPRVQSIIRTYRGNLREETGRPDRLYNDVGYVDINPSTGAPTYFYYFKDYLGSVRAVITQYGVVRQADDYTASGIPVTQAVAYKEDNRKHTGKEWETFNGLMWYDNRARCYDPITMRFTSMDPLCEKYYHLSPYAHCANNPLKFADWDGNKVRARSKKEQFVVVNSFRLDDRAYIQFDKKGFIDQEILVSHESTSGNYNKLIELVLAPEIINIELRSSYDYIHNDW